MKKILTLFALCLSGMVSAAEIPEDYKASFVLPIAKNRVLSVSIPEGYKSLQPASVWDKAPLIEFIPNDGSTASLWSEIITIQKLIGRGISADKMTSLLMQQLSQAVKTTLLFKESSKNGYQMVYFALKYTHNGRQEILGAKYLSGPHDCEGVQYTIRLKYGQSEADALQKIKTFFDQNLKVIEN
jgi:hypothetical protein